MKWETYSKLTPEQKEEWKFRFKDYRENYISLHPLGIVVWVVLVSSVFILSAAIETLLWKDNHTVLLQVLNYHSAATNVLRFAIVGFFVCHGWNYVWRMIYSARERRFLRRALK